MLVRYPTEIPIWLVSGQRNPKVNAALSAPADMAITANPIYNMEGYAGIFAWSNIMVLSHEISVSGLWSEHLVSWRSFLWFGLRIVWIVLVFICETELFNEVYNSLYFDVDEHFFKERWLGKRGSQHDGTFPTVSIPLPAYLAKTTSATEMRPITSAVILAMTAPWVWVIPGLILFTISSSTTAEQPFNILLIELQVTKYC